VQDVDPYQGRNVVENLGHSLGLGILLQEQQSTSHEHQERNVSKAIRNNHKKYSPSFYLPRAAQRMESFRSRKLLQSLPLKRNRFRPLAARVLRKVYLEKFTMSIVGCDKIPKFLSF
jgi:hypothetical protein